MLDSLYVPTPSGRRAKVVSFLPTSPVQDDLEAIVEDLLPVVVDKSVDDTIINFDEISSVNSPDRDSEGSSTAWIQLKE